MAKKSKKIKTVKSRIPEDLGMIFIGDTSDVHPDSLAMVPPSRKFNDYHEAKKAATDIADAITEDTDLVTRIPGFRAVFAVATSQDQINKRNQIVRKKKRA